MMLDDVSCVDFYRRAIKIQSFLGAVPFTWDKVADCLSLHSHFQRLKFSFTRLWIAFGIFKVLHSIHNLTSEPAKSPSTLILYLFVLSSHFFISAAQFNLNLNRNDFIKLAGACQELNSRHIRTNRNGPGGEIQENNGGYYIRCLLTYQLSTPLTFALLYIVRPNKLPNYAEIFVGFLPSSMSRLVYVLWIPMVAYEWAFVLATVQFYMFTAILYCKETIYWLRYLR